MDFSRVRAFVALLTLMLVHTESARAQLAVSPIMVRANVLPASYTTLDIKFLNHGQAPLDCELSVHAMIITGDGRPEAVPDAPRSCRDWLGLEPARFTLKQGEARRVPIRVRVPATAKGGYYGVILAKGSPARSPAEGGPVASQAGVRFGYASAVPVLLSVPGPDVRAVIEGGRLLVKNEDRSNGYILGLPVRNLGNTHAHIVGEMELRSQSGVALTSVDLTAGRGLLLPDHERILKGYIKEDLPDGQYVARVALTVEGSRTPMQKEFPFYLNEGKASAGEPDEELAAKLARESAGFVVRPLELKVEIPPGGVRPQAIELTNLTNSEFEVRGQAMDWFRTPDGTDLVIEESVPHGRSGREYLSLRLPRLTLRPRAVMRIPVAVSLPREADGEYYAAVTFERTDRTLSADPRDQARRSSLIRASVPSSARPTASVLEFSAHRQPNGAIDFTTEFEATGKWGFIPEFTIQVVDGDNKTHGSLLSQPDALFVQAGAKGTVTAQLRELLPPGPYRATLSFRFAPNAPPIIRNTNFAVPGTDSPQ